LAIKQTAYATSKKEANRYASYLALFDYYGLPVELDDEEEDDE